MTGLNESGLEVNTNLKQRSTSPRPAPGCFAT